jgi:hypothetical protein
MSNIVDFPTDRPIPVAERMRMIEKINDVRRAIELSRENLRVIEQGSADVRLRLRSEEVQTRKDLSVLEAACLRHWLVCDERACQCFDEDSPPDDAA